MQNQQNGISKNESDKKPLDIKYIVSKLLGNWYWFLLSLILVMGLAVVFVIYATPQYNITAKILVNGSNGNNSTSGVDETDLLSQLGLFSQQSDVNNELQVLLSRTLLEKTIHDLQLNVTYWGQGSIRYQETYNQSPFFIKNIKPARYIYRLRPCRI